MCDEIDLQSFKQRGINRRQFGAVGVLASLAACTTTAEAEEAGLTESDVTITTADGTMDAFFVHPAGKSVPAVIIWPDIAGLRDAFKMMARRLAASNYAVLVANPYYRSAKAPQFEDFADWAAQGGMQKVGPWREQLTPEAIMRDATSLTGWLDAQDGVKSSAGIGTQGYCMGGPFTVWSAAGVPSRIKAACSFHGGGLVGEGDTAPINLFDDAEDTHFLIAIAKNDDARAPDDKTKLRAAADAAGVEAEIEVFGGDHGWTVYDSPVYDEAEGEKAWARLLATYQAAL